LFRNVEANLDSTNVIEALNNRHTTQYTYLGTIAMECTQLCSSFNNINFSHVRRQANQAAQYLAKFAISITSHLVLMP